MVTQSTHSLKQQHRRQTQRLRRKALEQREERRQWAIAQAQHQKLDRELDAWIGRE